MSILLPEQCCLNYWSSQVIQELWCSINFEIGNCASSNSFFFFKIALVSLGLLHFDVNFRINLLNLAKKKESTWDFKRDYIAFVRLVLLVPNFLWMCLGYVLLPCLDSLRICFWESFMSLYVVTVHSFTLVSSSSLCKCIHFVYPPVVYFWVVSRF